MVLNFDFHLELEQLVDIVNYFNNQFIICDHLFRKKKRFQPLKSEFLLPIVLYDS